ncbi:MAG: YiaA/YiaB family inner membrane protein [Myxococcales bacterium]|nr:YiaA/YiaB family inner membrane protein [Myxococcales bacterium]
MDNTTQSHSGAWRLQVIVAFIMALGLTSIGIYVLPVDFWTKGFLGMGLYFTVSSAFCLAKTLRDEHESSRLVSKISEAKTEKMLREYGNAA